VSSEHERAVDEVLAAGRLLSTAAVMFHTAIAEHSGLTATESKALEVIQRLGPITPGELAAESGLAPASVTGLLDRLTRKGVARRTPHPRDGRRFLVEIEPDLVRRNEILFARFVAGLRELCARHTTAELAVVSRFMTAAAAVQQEATVELVGDSPLPGRRNA
jgi:DNA-binding MarR family transcriptional regulator